MEDDRGKGNKWCSSSLVIVLLLINELTTAACTVLISSQFSALHKTLNDIRTQVRPSRTKSGYATDACSTRTVIRWFVTSQWRRSFSVALLHTWFTICFVFFGLSLFFFRLLPSARRNFPTIFFKYCRSHSFDQNHKALSTPVFCHRSLESSPNLWTTPRFRHLPLQESVKVCLFNKNSRLVLFTRCWCTYEFAWSYCVIRQLLCAKLFCW